MISSGSIPVIDLARLYVEYLQLIADFWPAVFVMENVKGMQYAA